MAVLKIGFGLVNWRGIDIYLNFFGGFERLVEVWTESVYIRKNYAIRLSSAVQLLLSKS